MDLPQHPPGTGSRPGLLIVVEGIDGGGKSTLLDALAAFFGSAERRVFRSAEPTRGVWGERLRAPGAGLLPVATQIDYFERDRREHVDGLVNPALGNGDVVLLDRYFLSTAAYQGAKGASPDEILARNRSFAPEPNLWIVLDLPVNEAIQRIACRGAARSTFESSAWLAAARAIYREFCDRNPSHALLVDATQTPEAIRAQVIERIHRALNGCSPLATVPPAETPSSNHDLAQ